MRTPPSQSNESTKTTSGTTSTILNGPRLSSGRAPSAVIELCLRLALDASIIDSRLLPRGALAGIGMRPDDVPDVLVSIRVGERASIGEAERLDCSISRCFTSLRSASRDASCSAERIARFSVVSSPSFAHRRDEATSSIPRTH
eukprot:5667849-Prymnesium_polylepis.1